ncbi:MAG: hypothetical protein R3A52_06690 [Polyangiales bacterium]
MTGYLGSQGRGPKIAAYQGRVGLLWLEAMPRTLYFTTLRADGTAEGTPRLVSYRAEEWSRPALASDGARFGMTCQTVAAPSSNSSSFSRGYVFDASGAVVTLAGGLARSVAPASLFWDGARYVGFGSTTAGPLVHHLAADGSTLTSAAPAGTIGTGSIAQVGAVFFGDVTGATEPAVRRFDSDGRSLDPFPIPFGGSGTRVLGSDGSVVLGVWTSDNGTTLRAARLSRDGDVLDALPWNLSVAGDPLVPAVVAYGGGVWTIAGRSDMASLRRIEARQVDGAGHVLRSLVVESSAPTSGSPRMVWNGTEFVIAGTHLTSSPACNLSLRVWGVSPSGAVSPPGGVTVEDRPCLFGHEHALAARADGTTAIAWVADDDIYATRRCVARLLAPGMGLDAGTTADAGADATVDRLDVGTDTGATNDTGPADVGVTDTGPRDSGVTDTGPRDSGVTDTGIDVPVVMPDVPVVTDVGVTDVPAVTDVGGDDVPPAVDAPSVDVAPVEDVPVTDAATTDVAVTVDAGTADVPTITDAGTPDVGVATDASPIPDAGAPADASPVTDAGPSADVGAAPPPEDEGGCDVGGRAGGRSRSPLAASLSLLALALASRRRSR